MSPEKARRPVLPAGYAIRPLRGDDAPAMAAAYVRNREHLEQWDPTRDLSFYTVAGQQDAIDRQLSLVHGGLLGAWVLVRDEAIVGRANLNNVIRGVLCSASVGYWVDRDHLRRGLASAAVEHACVEAFEMGLHRVEAGTMVHNVASQRVLLRAGFEQYGMAPRFLFISGAWQDHNLYQRILHDDPLPVAPPGSGGAGGQGPRGDGAGLSSVPPPGSARSGPARASARLSPTPDRRGRPR